MGAEGPKISAGDGQQLEWVEGHAGHIFNEVSDDFAKRGTTLPKPTPARPTSKWDVIRHGELVLPPDKTWTFDHIPSHSHDHFHPLSWRPLKFRRLAWHKWLFGPQSRIGYAHYASFWADRPSPHDCSVCATRHNSSVHGTLAQCSHDHPLVAAWVSSWPCPALVSSWHSTAHRRDLRIAGRLGVQISLYRLLRPHQGGSRAARQVVSQYQDRVLDRVTAALASAIPPSSRRPSVFSQQDWHTPLPLF